MHDVYEKLVESSPHNDLTEIGLQNGINKVAESDGHTLYYYSDILKSVPEYPCKIVDVPNPEVHFGANFHMPMRKVDIIQNCSNPKKKPPVFIYF